MKLKKLMELREVKQNEMKALLAKANTEERALNTEERESFDALEAEIRDIDATIKAYQSARDLEDDAPSVEEEEEKEERSVEQREYDDFDAFLRSEVRAESTMTMTDNGAVVPASIANKIIEKVVEICPIFADADRYNVKGNLTIPYYDEATSDIMMAYADEDTDGESTSGTFKSISLGGFLGRAITDVSKSLINNSNFDIVDFVVARMAKAIARFIEGELLNGTDGKVAGLSGVTQKVVCASATAITSDEIIDLQESVPDVYQPNAYFVMSKATRTAIRKLKDGQGNYLLNKDANSRWGYTLFGKDVYTTDNMSNIATGKTAMYYGDMLGLAVKVSEDVNIDVLRETKARKHMVEVLGFVEFDAKVQNAQMISALVMA
jgi:HK97 family phage major capsid protein